jgi:hypothetical protein
MMAALDSQHGRSGHQRKNKRHTGPNKKPNGFNALAIIISALLGWRLSIAEHVYWPFVWAVFVFIIVVTVGLDVFALVNPRFLAYGPKE